MTKAFLRLALACACVLPTLAPHAASAAKKIVFLSGKPSHGRGAHEHYAGCLLLANRLRVAMPEYDVIVHQYDWPEDESAFEGADSVVIYCDGGGRHMANAHLEQMDKLMKKGVGLVCIHYAVEVPKGEIGNRFLEWLGGYFETHWSVNPHWTAEFKKLPDHPVARGVKPFSIRDEWYFHMRFREKMKGVTPILSAVPPESTMSRPDGPHSGNKYVREEVAKGLPQHVAWATERKDDGRAFGFTGGHFHKNWADDNFRKVLLNAIVWTAGGEVPKNGVTTKTPTQEEIEANQDEPKRKKKKQPKKLSSLPAPNKAAFASKTVSADTPGHSVKIDVDIKGAKKLYLVVSDAGDGFSCDWADWVEPKLVGPSGEKKLTDLKWKSARAGWGQVRVNRNAGNGELLYDGHAAEYGIGTHANSVIEFELPAGYERFQARGALDNGGTNQGCGSTVQFLVFLDKLPASVARAASGGGAPVSREPEDAVAALDVADGLEVSLFAAEPMLMSPSNIDVDHKGRVWVCEVVNYRHFANKNNPVREEGDRILILEDTDGDGRADDQKVFYQGRDIDSAHGVCVLGNRVIVSALDKVLVFTDTNGDDKADKKDVLFSGISGAQHDHGIHSFTFGPDGRLYFNFGNAGKQLKDANGNPIVDLAGNVVAANRKPYQEGMVFRCDLDGSNVETLGWNFRNNWEVAVDSFGTLWQSDNDDDGNRGVRINYVMEFGNYGYKDELTGAGWRAKRTGMHEEIPKRHWHLNDPGVVPNLLQTGAGSPTGILVYEGNLLPEVFHNQVIHCDAGPNVVRAYPVANDGAGYKASIVNILEGTRDKWFRPSDVCVAPDGSLIVADWYDPGVGGHRMGDVQRGRLFRIAPPETAYTVPEQDLSTIDGAVEALQSPNLATRYLAWQALHERGPAAKAALDRVFDESKNARIRARALWLLAQLPGQHAAYIEKALADENPNIRIVGIRLARQFGANLLSVAARLAKDKSPQIRRECAIALRTIDDPRAAEVWTLLAMQHDGRDRWYLEALGIAADGRWDGFLAHWLDSAADSARPAVKRDIIWRSRGEQTTALLAELIRDPQTPDEELPRLFRALDFQRSPKRDPLIAKLAFEPLRADEERENFIRTEALARLKGFDVSKNPKYRAALDGVLASTKGTAEYVSLVDRFSLADQYPELLKIAQSQPDSQVGVEATRTLLGKRQIPLIKQGLNDENVEVAVNTARALGNSSEGRVGGLLMPLVTDENTPLEVRRQAVRGVARINRRTALEVLGMAQSGKLDPRLKPAVAASLHNVPWNDVKEKALELFPLPPSKNAEPLPPIADLVKRKGDVSRGAKIFATTGTCAKCHKVNGNGKEVGPDLSEIGSKLSRQAFYTSILFPSAGISHNFEAYTVQTTSGAVVTGLLVSKTDEEISIKSDDAIVRTFKMDEIEGFKKEDVSLMPADIQKLMTARELVDVVEYMTTLKKPKRKAGLHSD